MPLICHLSCGLVTKTLSMSRPVPLRRVLKTYIYNLRGEQEGIFSKLFFILFLIL